MPEVRLIDANALIQNHCGACANKEFCAEESCPYYEIRHRIEAAPTIEPEQRHGQWECGGFCSECGLDNEERKTPYCPNCGARMDGGADNG